MLQITRVISPVRFFDERSLRLARWMSERYVTPLATALGAMSPPRVAGEEVEGHADGPAEIRGVASLLPSASPRSEPPGPSSGPPAPRPELLQTYSRGADLLGGIAAGAGAFVLRPAAEEEQTLAVEAVGACLAAGRRAIVLVPEASPRPATATALLEAFGDRVCLFVGGDRRQRYRTWLDVRAGRFDVLVGTRPAVFAPVGELGLVFISRESHPAHREERAPYYHVRDVGLRRATIEGAACVLAALCPSAEVAALELPSVTPSGRRWPKVEVVRPGPEGRAPRLIQALKTARRAFVLSPAPGYGIAQVCRTCGAPAACASCGGILRLEGGAIRCIVCAAAGACATCGGSSFGIRRGGAERVEEWVARVATVPVARPARPRLPKRSGEVVIGGPEQVRDLGVGGLDLVAVLDADAAARRPGLAARERALAVWMEAVGWARPGGRAIVQSSSASDPAVQALVRGNPDRFLAREQETRAAAGFPVGACVFRVVGTAELAAALDEHHPITSLITTLGERTVCLLALEPGRVPAFGRAMRRLAGTGVVERVEAEPHL